MQYKFLTALVLSSVASSALAAAEPQVIDTTKLDSVASNINGAASTAESVGNAITSAAGGVASYVKSVASSEVSALTSLVGGIPSSVESAYFARVSSVESHLRSDLSAFTSFPYYASVVSGWESAAASGTAAAASYVHNLPSSLDSSFRVAVASVLVSAASEVTSPTPTATATTTGGTATGTGTGAAATTTTKGAGNKVALASSMMGAAAILAIVLAL